jgi:hypothetical protein
MIKLPLLLLAAMSLSLSTALSQTSAAVTYTPDQLIQQVDQMREQAKTSKEPPTGILEKHLDASTILAFRDRDGKGEL